MAISETKLVAFGSVRFIPVAHFDEVSESMMWQGEHIRELQPSEELAGHLAWITPGWSPPVEVAEPVAEPIVEQPIVEPVVVAPVVESDD